MIRWICSKILSAVLAEGTDFVPGHAVLVVSLPIDRNCKPAG